MSTILDRIVETKWTEVARAKQLVSEVELRRQVDSLPIPIPRRFATALSVPGEVRVIAEVKKASPSAGVIRADFDPVSIAKTYESHGAAAISVLTDEEYFQGHLSYLSDIRRQVQLPLLRKEFILDRYQLLEARVAGASAVLLIAEILPGNRLRELWKEARELELEVLVELHDADQLSRVVDSGANIIGINNRDLRTFETRLEHTLELLPQIPTGTITVSESGIRTHEDMQLLAQHGVNAVLVGESLMRSPDIGLALRGLITGGG